MNTEMDTLIQHYLEGRISQEEMARLNAALEGSEEMRREFTAWLRLDAAIGDLAAGWVATAPVATAPVAKSRILPFSEAGTWLAAAASLVLLAGVAVMWEAVSRPYALVAKTGGAEELARHSGLRGETVEIRAGTVKLLTRRGAELVIEAPATFRFESAQRLHLLSGRLSAEVPPAAKGFTVVTPDGDAVDLGTRFGVDVPESGPSEIHVFEGEVIARAPGLGEDRNLRTGEALTMSRRNTEGGDARELRSAAFIQAEELPSLTAGLAAGQESRSHAAAAVLRQDPQIIALIEFGDEPNRPGVYRFVQGRWPGSRAAEFVEAGDHLILDIGGGTAWPQLTLAAWVRLDRLGAPYQSLLHTDGWSEENPGQVHWMINRDATMRLALRGNALAPGSDERHGYPDSLTPVLPEQGRWVHLAVVHDSEKGTVRFYLNGRFDKETRQQTAHPARLGPAQIGNWDREDRKLSGRIDQLLILGRAMSDAEIEELHEAGTPYR